MVQPKASIWWMRWIDRILRILSLGRMRSFMTDYVTTIGETIYTPSNWARYSDRDRYALLVHEGVHVEQWRTHGWWYAVSYLLGVPGFAPWRARWEREAYDAALRWRRSTGEDVSGYREAYIAHFAGPAYLWMWPFRAMVSRWFEEVSR